MRDILGSHPRVAEHPGLLALKGLPCELRAWAGDPQAFIFLC